jgi:hypothetical protein
MAGARSSPRRAALQLEEEEALGPGDGAALQEGDFTVEVVQAEAAAAEEEGVVLTQLEVRKQTFPHLISVS